MNYDTNIPSRKIIYIYITSLLTVSNGKIMGWRTYDNNVLQKFFPAFSCLNFENLR